MPVVKTTSPTAERSAPQSSPSKRAPSSSSTYPGWRSLIGGSSSGSQDELLDGLELGRAGALEQLEQRGLDGANDGAGALEPLEAALVVEHVARADGGG